MSRIAGAPVTVVSGHQRRPHAGHTDLYSPAATAAPPAYADVVTLTATGVLDAGVPTPGLTATVPLDGVGQLGGVGVPSVPAAPALTGAGALAVTGRPSWTVTPNLTGGGALTVQAQVPAVAAPVSLAGTGTLATAGAPAVAAPPAALAGTGVLDVTGQAVQAGTWRMYAAASPPATGATDAATLTVAVEFYVTSPATLTEIRWWQPATGAVTGSRTGGLWQVTTGTTGTQVATTSTVAPSGAGWQTLPISGGYTLTPNTRYRAGVWQPANGYVNTLNYYTTGNGTDEQAGPLVIPHAANATGGLQGSFHYAASLTYPDSSYSDSSYWVDVTVVTGAPALTGAVPLAGGGSLTATGAAAAAGSANFTGAGGLAGVGAPSPVAGVALTSTGQLSAAAAPSTGAGVPLAGGGQLGVTPGPGFAAGAGLTGEGSLTVSGTVSTTPAARQTGYRFRNDDGSETSATWKAARDTPVTQPSATPFRVRFEVTGSGVATDWQLMFSRNGGAWTPVTATSATVQSVLSPNVTESQATTQQMGGSGTFVAGSVTESDGYLGTVTFPTGGICEFECVVQLVAATAVNGDTVTLKLAQGNWADLAGGYAQTASLTVGAAQAFSGPVSLTGSGSLTSAGVPAVAAPVALAAAGVLGLAVVPSPAGAPTLAGGGSLALAGGPVAVAGPVALAGAGSLTVTTAAGQGGSAALYAAGSLGVAASAVAAGGAAAVTATGVLGVVAAPSVAAAPALTATGALGLVAVPAARGAPSLSASGALAAVSVTGGVGAAQLSAVGSLTAAGRQALGAGEDFEGFTTGTWAEQSIHGKWLVEFLSGGTAQIIAGTGTNTSKVLRIESQPPASAGQTFSALVTSEQTRTGDVDFTIDVRSLAQLRATSPNLWEVAWIGWNFTRTSSTTVRYYYATLKPGVAGTSGGFELGKVDQDVFTSTGGQRFLWTDASTVYPPGTTWHTVRVQQAGARIRVWVDGTLKADFTDGPGSGGTPAWGTAGETVLTSGGLALYEEDSRVEFDNLTVGAPPQAVTLTSTGTLTGAGVPRPTGAAQLTATGSLTVPAPVPAVSGAAAFTASTALTISTAGGGAGTVPLTGAASLTLATLVAVTGAGALTGQGSLTISPAGLTAAGVAALSASGALSVPGRTPSAGAAVTLTTTGALALGATAGAGGVATLSGAGSLVVLGGGGAGLVPLTASGALGVGASALTVSAGVALAGVGALALGASLAAGGSAATSGVGVLAVAGAPALVATMVALAAAGTLTGAGRPAAAGAAALTGAGTLLGGQIIPAGFTGAGTLSVAGVPTPGQLAALTALGALTLAALRPGLLGGVTLAGAGALLVAPAVTASGAVLLAAAGALTGGVGVPSVAGRAAFTAAGVLVVVGHVIAKVTRRRDAGLTTRSHTVTPRPRVAPPPT